MTQGIVKGEGLYYSPSSIKVPLKVDKRGHEWIVIAVFTLSYDEVVRSFLQGAGVQLDPENLADFQTPVCRRCEILFNIISAHPCPGDPAGYDTDGTPIFVERWVNELIKEWMEKYGRA